MMIDYIYVGLACILVPILRMRGLFGMEDFKNHVLTILSIGSLLYHIIIYGQIPYVTSAAGIWFLYFLCLLTISILWSINKTDSIFDLVRWFSLFYFFIICSRLPAEYVLTAVFITAPFMAAYGLSQQFFSKDFIDPFYTKTLYKFKKCFAWLGNTNYIGAYLTPCFFIGLSLTFYSSYFWFFGVIPIAVALFFARCRAAWLGTLIGIISIGLYFQFKFLSHWLLIADAVIFFFIIKFMLKHYSKMLNDSFLGRIYYWKASWELIKKYPLFGLGPRAFRYHLINTQAEMNRIDPTILGNLIDKPKNPSLSAKRAHNDHIETLLEIGFVGFALWVGILIMVLSNLSQNPFLFGGIIAVIVNSAFFFSIRTSATALPIMALWANSTLQQAAIQISFLPGLILVAVILYIAYLFVFKRLKGNFYFLKLEDIAKIEDKKNIGKFSLETIKAEPTNNIYLQHHAALYRNHIEGLISALKAIFYYDGTILKWQLWHLAGVAALQNGLLNFAKTAFNESLSLYPGYLPAHEGLKKVESITESYKKVTTKINEANKKRTKKAEKRKAMFFKKGNS